MAKKTKYTLRTEGFTGTFTSVRQYTHAVVGQMNLSEEQLDRMAANDRENGWSDEEVAARRVRYAAQRGKDAVLGCATSAELAAKSAGQHVKNGWSQIRIVPVHTVEVK